MLKIVRRVSKHLKSDVVQNWHLLEEYCRYLHALLEITTDVRVEVWKRENMWDSSPVGSCSCKQGCTLISYHIHKRSSLIHMYVVLAHEFIHAEQRDISFRGDGEADAEKRSLEIATVWVSGKVRPNDPFLMVKSDILLAREFIV